VLSSDKAAAPLNLYGKTKAVAEDLTRAAQHYTTPGCAFAAVRYGNVAGSRGSVIPAWRDYLAKGGRWLPVTDTAMTRFWMTLPDAVQLVLDALGNMEGGELFIPKLRTFKILDLAAAITTGMDQPICTDPIGIRPGEKLAETLITKDEAPYFRDCDDWFVRFPQGREVGEPLPEGFEYRSDNPGRKQMSVEALREALENV
jgi:UDP-N-acetylglucosamine 4,6-dehydratase/5-epimerase